MIVQRLVVLGAQHGNGRRAEQGPAAGTGEGQQDGLGPFAPTVVEHPSYVTLGPPATRSCWAPWSTASSVSRSALLTA